MNNASFWLWTLFFALLSYLGVKIICLCTSYRPSEKPYFISLLKKPIPLHTYKTYYVNKIDSENV